MEAEHFGRLPPPACSSLVPLCSIAAMVAAHAATATRFERCSGFQTMLPCHFAPRGLDTAAPTGRYSASSVTEPGETAVDIASWLQNLGLERYEATFRENDLDAELLPNLTAEDLKELGITSLGHRLRLLEAIAALRLKDTPADDPVRLPTSKAGNLGSSETTAERRPLSVMFCDLVGSTTLSARLDPEDLREVIRSYQACVANTIQQFDGFIARYVGDGVLIYFGWPEARETDAERAVRAALAVAAAVSAAPVGGELLQVRIGIATGLVVIGEPIGSGDSRQQTAVGETPNLAARLQGLAGPNQVVIDAATRRQIGGLFECQDLGTVELKGLPVAVPVWKVLSENRSLGQFEALRSGATPLVGREEEMELLLRRWAQAKAGSGRVVLISAEPGGGKSRLAEALVERIATEPHVRLRYFCSPHHQNSALYPVIAQMERAAGFAQDAPAAKVAKLRALLAATDPPMEDMALIAELHSLPSADLAPPLEITPQRRKDKTFAALLRQVEGLSRQQPVLMLFDDLHWIDPSSRDLLDRVIERVADWPVLLLAMFRPEFQPPWTGQPHATLLALARLDRRDTAAMVANVAGSVALPPEIMEEIAERTDGVPLFVEELTKAVIEAGGQAALSGVPHPALSVPATLHASLMARLDRLGPAAKDVAQTGAAIGREFGYGLLVSATDLPEPQLREALDRLTNAGLLFVRGAPPQSSYIFKHALVQDAAYGTLLRSRRQLLHSRIVASLEARFPEIVLAQPALLAQHCAAAGLAERAVVYWLKAGQQALARSAMAEAVAQLRKGLEVLSGLPDGQWRQEQELDLQSALASALTATKGWSGAEVDQTLARARGLAEQLNRSEYLAPLIVGQWAFHLVRSEHKLAAGLGEMLERIGETRDDQAARLLGRLMHGIARFFLGELVTARAVLERCMGLADPANRNLAGLSFDPYALMLSWLALSLAYLGYIDQARSRMDEALSEARRVRHVHTLAHVFVFASWIDWLTCSPVVHVVELLALTTQHGFPHYLGWALAHRGRSLVALGQTQEGLDLLNQGLAELRATGGVVSTPMVFIWLAEAHTMLRQPAEARNWLAEAARVVETTDERVSEAELVHRVTGDMLNAAGDRSAAEQHYRQAIAVAERQSARLLQLRASVSLARLWRDQGKPMEARDLLGPIYNWFTEGFDAPDLKDAKALLAELA
jgi:class 3 adenylate cyclase/tetratricopeptide (TPR) repeat protein